GLNSPFVQAYRIAKGVRQYIYGDKEQVIEDIIDYYEQSDVGERSRAHKWMKEHGIIG
ncbi:unnamed protein product, partial [marine sediment metagenome]